MSICKIVKSTDTSFDNNSKRTAIITKQCGASAYPSQIGRKYTLELPLRLITNRRCCKTSNMTGMKPSDSKTLPAHRAVHQGQHYMRDGYRWIVNMFLVKFLGIVKHDVLMQHITRWIADWTAFILINRILKTGISISGTRERVLANLKYSLHITLKPRLNYFNNTVNRPWHKSLLDFTIKF